MVNLPSLQAQDIPAFSTEPSLELGGYDNLLADKSRSSCLRLPLFCADDYSEKNQHCKSMDGLDTFPRPLFNDTHRKSFSICSPDALHDNSDTYNVCHLTLESCQSQG